MTQRIQEQETDITPEERDILAQLQRLAAPRSVANNAILINSLARQLRAENKNHIPAVVRSLALKGYLGDRLKSQMEIAQREQSKDDRLFHMKPKKWWEI